MLNKDKTLENNGNVFLKNYCLVERERREKNVNEYLWLCVISFERYALDDIFCNSSFLLHIFMPD